ncbi:hypothetical protein B0O99DRAFT_92802 [Bisporella sp. PMI_857]|nr:hypothetical protein B0O99DRAFT_92802 [Bisporella sp. PMI_857]
MRNARCLPSSYCHYRTLFGVPFSPSSLCHFYYAIFVVPPSLCHLHYAIFIVPSSLCRRYIAWVVLLLVVGALLCSLSLPCCNHPNCY